MSRSTLHAIACLSLTSLLAGAADLTVRVADTRDQAIPAATVALTARDGERRSLTTDENGSARFTSLPPGEYLVEGDAPGFDAASPRSIQIRDGAPNQAALSLGVAQVRTSVVVTASGTPQTADEVSKALTVVDGDTMALRADRSVGEALEDVPGLHVQQLGGPGSTVYFKVRGLRNEDTAVLVDGMRLRDAAGTQADASDVLQDLVLTDTSRIEILRGAGSSLYGTDATGGVVNIVTDPGGGRTHGSVLADGGSLGSVRGVARLAGGLANGRFDYSLGVTHWNVMGGLDGDSPARNTSPQGQAAYRFSRVVSLSARIYFGDSLSFVRSSPMALGNPAATIVPAIPVSLSAEHQYESGVPLSQLSLGSATFLQDTFDPDSTRAGRFFTGAFRLNVHPSERVGFTAQYQELRTTRDYGDGPAGQGFYQPTGTNLSDYFGKIRTANARVDLSVGRYQQIDAGYEFEYEDFQEKLIAPPPDGTFFTDVSQRSNAIFVQDQLQFAGGRFRLAAGYRAQFYELDQPVFQPVSGAPFAGKTFGAPPAAQTGDVSAAYTIRQSRTKFRLHAGRGYRAPALYERFGVFYSQYGYSLFGDPGLRPDRSSSIDGGVDQTLWNGRALLSATYFYTKLNEVIIFDFSGAINPATDPLGRDGGYRNTGGGLARGVESSASVAVTRSLQFTANYTYTDSRQRTPLVPGVWQTYESPRQQYGAFVTQRFTPRLTGYFGYSGTSSYLADISGFAFRFDGPSRMRAGLSYRRPLGEYQALRVYVKGDNLLNQTYFENGFRTPGATFTAGTQFEF